MSELSEAVGKVRRKIIRYRGKRVNEQDTKATLIQPILRAELARLEALRQEFLKQRGLVK